MVDYHHLRGRSASYENPFIDDSELSVGGTACAATRTVVYFGPLIEKVRVQFGACKWYHERGGVKINKDCVRDFPIP
nr:CBM_HP1_G0003820.mRNA.1.CDS.1 [Saccharomyces cerevisiae]